MKALLVFAHPNPDSFNGAVLKVAKDTLDNGGHEVKVKDLYQMGWNPLLTTDDLGQIYAGKVPADIAAEQADVTWADMVVFIYPIWWFEQPAILKGWFDRVFTYGFAYKTTDNGMIEGLLKGKRAVVITTSGANEDNMRQNGILDAINTCMIQGTLAFSGFQNIIYENLFSVPTITDEERKQLLNRVSQIFRQ